MTNTFLKDVSILTNNHPTSSEFHLYEVGYEKCRPTKPSEYAPIDYWVLHYCIDGEGYFSTPDLPEQHVTSGDLFMIPANCRNVYYPNRINPWSYLWIGFSGSLAETYLQRTELTTEHCIIQGSFDKKIETLFANTYDAFKENNTFLALSEVFSLLNYLALRHSHHQELTQNEQLFQQISHYLDEHFADGITIAQTAAANNVDRTYLFKLFQKYLGTNPSVYLQQLKLQKACSLLRKSSLNITEISYECGFSSPSYFSKFFLSKMNLTPLTYRNQFLTS